MSGRKISSVMAVGKNWRAREMAAWPRVAEMALKRAQRRVSRRVKGSHRRRKAVALLAKAHQHVRRARQDFHHKTALALVQHYDTMYQTLSL